VEVVAFDHLGTGLGFQRLDVSRLYVDHTLLVLGDPLDEQDG
jgi:hypothetical protein